MLALPLLALAGAFLLPQDAPATGTSETVRTFLRQAESGFYEPQADGLTSLSFIVPIEEQKANLELMLARSGVKLPPETPDIIRMLSVAVTWELGGESQIETTVADSFPSSLEMMRPMLEGSGRQMGQQTLSAALNSLIDFGPVLESYDARIDGAEGDYVKVVFERKAGVSEEVAPPETLTWLFDDDGLPAGTRMSINQQGPMGPLEVKIDTEYSWQPARASGGKKVLASVASKNEMGGFGSVEQSTTYRYEEIGGVVVMVGYRETVKQDSPFMEMPESVRDVTFEGLVVNGGGGAGG